MNYPTDAELDSVYAEGLQISHYVGLQKVFDYAVALTLKAEAEYHGDTAEEETVPVTASPAEFSDSGKNEEMEQPLRNEPEDPAVR